MLTVPHQACLQDLIADQHTSSYHVLQKHAPFHDAEKTKKPGDSSNPPGRLCITAASLPSGAVDSKFSLQRPVRNCFPLKDCLEITPLDTF